MRIILIENINNLGKKGDTREVSDGYARNFLLPRKLAEVATPDAINKSKIQAEKSIEKEKEGLEKIKKLAQELEGKEIIIKAKAKKGKLFGSIGKKEISKELKKKGLDVSENNILLENPIKEIGDMEISVGLSKGIEAKIRLIIEEE